MQTRYGIFLESYKGQHFDTWYFKNGIRAEASDPSGLRETLSDVSSRNPGAVYHIRVIPNN